jgi:hypothetical protein
VNQAYSYEITYTVTKADGTETEAKTTEITGLCRLHLDGEELEDAVSISVKIRANDGCGEESHYSDWTEVDNLSVKEVLPTPQVHFEMLYNGLSGSTCANGKLIAILDNPEDYIVDGQAVAKIEISGIKMTIDPTIGYVTTAADIDSKQYSPIKAYASAIDTSKYANSATYANVAYIAGKNVMNDSAKYDTVDFNGFYGDTTGNLSYSMKINKTITTNNYELSSSQEVMAYDDTVGAVISYAHGVTVRSEASASSLTLSGFPADLTSKDEIIVKNMIWASQKNVVYYGHTVADSITLAELKNLQDEDFYKLSGKAVTKITQSVWKEIPILKDGKLTGGSAGAGELNRTTGQYGRWSDPDGI